MHQTAEFTEKQLDELLLRYAHERLNHEHVDLEAELELVDAFPEVFPEATPASLPGPSSLRLAHTLRRAAQIDIGPAAKPALTTRPAPDTPPFECPAGITQPTATLSASEPALTTPEAEPPPAAVMQALPPAVVATSVPLFAAGTPRRSFWLGAGRACLVFFGLFLVTLGAAALLLQ